MNQCLHSCELWSLYFHIYQLQILLLVYKLAHVILIIVEGLVSSFIRNATLSARQTTFVWEKPLQKQYCSIITFQLLIVRKVFSVGLKDVEDIVTWPKWNDKHMNFTDMKQWIDDERRFLLFVYRISFSWLFFNL